VTAVVVDVNLSPEWVPYLAAAGHPAVHWTAVGDRAALDPDIMAWARTDGRAVFTRDLDFTTLLALTGATGPSVVQLRGADVLPEQVGPAVLSALRQFDAELTAGALVTVDPKRARVRVLPIRRAGAD
jgi:predicted nuclease of predicted toxin-antitoxin system